MNHIIITDIFNNKIYTDGDKYQFLIIHTDKPHSLLTKLSNVSNIDGIWKLNMHTIKKVLHAKNINPNLFNSAGDIWLPTSLLPNKMELLIVNDSVSVHPVDYIKIDSYTDLNIWKPVSPNNYNEIGFIASQNKPPLDQTKVINKAYLLEIEGQSSIVGRNSNMNEFNLLGNINSSSHTIDKTKLKKRVWKSSMEGKKTVLLEPEIPWYTMKEQDKIEPKTINIKSIMLQEQIDINVIISSLSLIILLLIVISYCFK